jgi:hypothetical protein
VWSYYAHDGREYYVVIEDGRAVNAGDREIRRQTGYVRPPGVPF